MTTRIWIAATLAACAATAADVKHAREEADTDNGERIEAKLVEVSRAHSLSSLTPLTEAPEPAAVRVEPGMDLVETRSHTYRLHQPSIVELEDGSLLYAVPSGCSGQTCSCQPVGEYRLAKAPDGKAVVVHLAHRTTVKTIKRRGSCGYGCGVPQPPRPPTYYSLPVGSRAQVAVIEEAVEQVVIEETCEKPIARP
jgi:hypothetical protein